MFPVGIHQRLDQAIRESGIPQAEIARRVGEAPSWLSKRITGRVPLRADEIPAIAAALRTTPAELAARLLSDEPPHEPHTPKQVTFAPLHQLPGFRELAIRAAREKYDEVPGDTSPEDEALAQITEAVHRMGQRIRQEVNHSG